MNDPAHLHDLLALVAAAIKDPTPQAELRAGRRALMVGLLFAGDRADLLGAIVADRIGELTDDALEDVRKSCEKEADLRSRGLGRRRPGTRTPP